MKIAVAGGIGTVGRHVVDVAGERGHEVVVLSRGHGVDLLTGVGLDAALEGGDVVIDTSNVQTVSAGKSVEFFTATTRGLLTGEEHAGIRHHVALSIVGVDRAAEGYYAGKLAQERAIEAGEVPWTILRATQFHEFAPTMYSALKIGPLHLAPRMRTQPVAAREVGERLVALAEAAPAGRATDLAGPREEALPDMIRAYAHAIGKRGWIPAISLPGGFGRAQRDGSVLPGPDADHGRQTFAEWVAAVTAARVTPARPRPRSIEPGHRSRRRRRPRHPW